MVTLKSFACEKCGGPLSIPEGAREITCPYCGAKKLVQGAERPAPIDGRHTPNVVVKTPNVGLILAIVGACTAMFVVGLLYFIFSMSEAPKGGSSVTINLPGMDGLKNPLASLGGIRFRGQPLLGKVNGDDVVDVIGECDSITATEPGFCAFDGRDGKLIYRNTKLEKDQLEGQALRIVVDSLFVIVDQVGKVQAFRLADGSPAWAGLVSDRGTDACKKENDLVIVAADDERYGFDLATGKKRSLEKKERRKRFACEPLWFERSEANPVSEIIGWSEYGEYGLPSLHAIEGLSAHRALVPREGTLRFMLGSKSKGTSVPMVAAVRDRKVVWMDVVPGVDPLGTKVNVTTQLAAYSGGTLVVPYDLKGSEGTRMAALDGETGKRLWDIEIHNDSQVSSGIAVTSDLVFYATWTELYAIDLKDGKVRFRIGKSLR